MTRPASLWWPLLPLLFSCCCNVLGQRLGNPCLTDADCVQSGKQVGYCIQGAGLPGKCSCFSGLGGECDNTGPALTSLPSCLISPVTINNAVFDPVSVMNLINNQIELFILLPPQVSNLAIIPHAGPTKVLFGTNSTQATLCDYPYSDGNNGITWEVGPPSGANFCLDEFVGFIPWAFAMQNCFFTMDTSNPNYYTFEGQFWVEREYTLGNLGSIPVNRTQVAPFPIVIQFPKVVVLSVTVTIYDAALVLVAILNLDYNVLVPQWEMTIQTSIQAPFAITNPMVTDTQNRITSASLSPCTSSPCTQTLLLTFGAGTGATCAALIGTIVMEFSLICNSPATCPPIPANAIVSAQAQVNTSSACPNVATVVVDAVLQSFSDVAFLNPVQTFFLVNSPFNVYFLLTINGAGATILSFSMDINSVQANGIPIPATAISVASPNQAAFQITIDANVAPWGSASSLTVYTISVSSDVVFLNGTKRQVQMKQTELATTSLVLQRETNEIPVLSIAEGYVCVKCIVIPVIAIIGIGIVLVLFVFFSKKRDNSAQYSLFTL